MIRFTVPGTPQGKGRPRVGKVKVNGQVQARMFTPEKTVAYEGLVKVAAHQAMTSLQLQPLTVAVRVSLFICCPIPASLSKKQQALAEAHELLPTKTPDIDNVIKAIFDGMNRVVWLDDKQVVDLTTRKRYGRAPGVAVEVAPLDQH